ncbi:ATP-binding protein [Sulfurimonas sp.]
MKNNIFLTIVVASLYFFSGKFSLDLLQAKHIVTIGMFAAEGFALAFALYFKERVLLGIFLGQFFLALNNDVNLFASLSIAGVNTAEAALAIWFARFLKFDKNFKKLQDVSILVFMIVFILQPWSAILSNIALYLFEPTYESNFWYSIFSWWFGNVMGQLLFTPFLLLLFSRFTKIELTKEGIYAALFFIYLFILEIILQINNPLLLLSLILPVTIIIVASIDLFLGTFFNILIALVSLYSVHHNIGAFSSNAELDNIINYNLFLLANILLVLIIGSLFSERKKYAQTLQKKIDAAVSQNQEQQLFMFQQSRLAQAGEMISMIAHQWRQPLNNLSLNNQLLIAKYKKNKLDDTQIAYFEKNSQKQVNLMSQTIDDFRNFFKPNKEKEEFELGEIIHDTLRILKSLLENKHISVSFKSKKKYFYNGNKNELTQVILNILKNAIDALTESNASQKKIIINLEKNDHEIFLSFEDNAGGIDKKIINKIFDPYFSTKENKNGTGLGLYMSKMILEEHMNATIYVQNTKEGARFEIRFKKL